MKIATVLTIGRITPLNAQDALCEVQQCISDIEDNLRTDREYIQTHPRAFGLTLVQSRRDENRAILRALRRREQQCSRLLQAT